MTKEITVEKIFFSLSSSPNNALSPIECLCPYCPHHVPCLLLSFSSFSLFPAKVPSKHRLNSTFFLETEAIFSFSIIKTQYHLQQSLIFMVIINTLLFTLSEFYPTHLTFNTNRNILIITYSLLSELTASLISNIMNIFLCPV